MNLGIIGQGFVGNAVYQKFKSFFNSDNDELVIADILLALL